MGSAESLKDRAIKGSIWSILERFFLQFAQLIVSIILARLLEPKDYGLIAITMIFVSISAALTDGGFEKTLIRKNTLNSKEINTVFYINAAFGAMVMLLLILTSTKIADFFEEPKLAPILSFVSLTIFFNALGQVQSILLRKELKFKKLSYVQVTASFMGGIIGIVLAYRGWGVWALAVSIVFTQFMILCLYWYKAEWYPKLEWSYSSIKPMIGYGSNILFSSLLFFVIQQFNTFIVGKFYSKAALGLFNRGSRFPELVINTVEGVVHKTSFPVFSLLQDDNLKLKNVLEKCVRVIAFISFPVLAILFVNAKDITIVLFTDKWSGSIIFLQLFCVAMFVHPFIGIFREVILAKGFASALTKIIIVSSIIEIGMVILAIKFGLVYVVLAVGISTLIQYALYSIYLFKKIDIVWLTHLRWVFPYLIISILIVTTGLLTNMFLESADIPQILKLFLNLSIGGIIVVLSVFIGNLKELEYIKYVFALIRSKIPKTLKYYI